MKRDVKDLVIVGAGPYGLATAAYAKQRHLDYLLLGQPMSFWRTHMLRDLILRSPINWHMDPTNRYSIADFLRQHSPSADSPRSLSKDQFLNYVDWFVRGHSIETHLATVERITRDEDSSFTLETEDQQILARRVVIATGLRQFRYLPAELEWLCLAGYGSHSSDHLSYDSLLGKAVLIVGGRQSAYEAVKELSASRHARVHVSHRHPTPSFTESNWGWIGDAVNWLRKDPNWFAALPARDRESIERRFWAEGREKLEPWLAESATRPNVQIHRETQIVKARLAGPQVEVELSDGAQLSVDHVLFATGYRVDVAKIDMLRELLPQIVKMDGYPELDSSMQSSVPGLHFTGLFCTRRFGPIFGFVLGCQAAPQIIIDSIPRDAEKPACP